MRGRGLWWLVALGAAVVAFAVRMTMVLRGGGLGGLFGYDDGVYYSAAGSLVWGRVPYRDFVLLHPPGVMVALTPFAALGRLTNDALGFETARLAWILVGAVNTGLVVATTRRFGPVAAATAGLFYAVWHPVAMTETTTRLEPLLSLGLLVALAVLANPMGERSRRAQVVAGCGLGLALAVKIWAVVPVVVVLLWCWQSLGTRVLRRVAAATAATALLVYLPFWLLAPGSMTRMVVLDQLARPRSSYEDAARLAMVLGRTAWWPVTWVTAAAVAGLVVLAATGAGAFGRWAVALLGVQLLVLLASPPFYSFYAAYVVPALAVVVAAGVAGLGRLAGRLPARGPRLLTGARAGTAAVICLGLALLASVDMRTPAGVPLPDDALARLTASSRCVTSDSPDVLALTGVLGRDLGRGCPVMVDVSGLTYDTAARTRDGVRVPRAADGAWQRHLRHYLLSGTTAFLDRPGDDGLSPRTLSVLGLLRVLHQGSGYTLYAVPPALRSPRPGLA